MWSAALWCAYVAPALWSQQRSSYSVRLPGDPINPPLFVCPPLPRLLPAARGPLAGSTLWLMAWTLLPCPTKGPRYTTSPLAPTPIAATKGMMAGKYCMGGHDCSGEARKGPTFLVFLLWWAPSKGCAQGVCVVRSALGQAVQWPAQSQLQEGDAG